STFGIDVDSMNTFVAADIDISNLFVRVRIHGGVIDCDGDVSAATTDILGDYDLVPLAADPNKVDVNQIGGVTVNFSSFNFDFTSGICDFPVIGDLISAIVGDVEPTVRSGLEDYLDDPDGSGPQDAPIADAVETALDGIDLAGPIGSALGADLDAPFFA